MNARFTIRSILKMLSCYEYFQLAASDSSSRNGSDFQADLVKYLNEYKTSQDWDLIEHWRDRVANIDLSHVKARVVYSVPGAHKGLLVHLISFSHFNFIQFIYSHILNVCLDSKKIDLESWNNMKQ